MHAQSSERKDCATNASKNDAMHCFVAQCSLAHQVAQWTATTAVPGGKEIWIVRDPG